MKVERDLINCIRFHVPATAETGSDWSQETGILTRFPCRWQGIQELGFQTSSTQMLGGCGQKHCSYNPWVLWYTIWMSQVVTLPATFTFFLEEWYIYTHIYTFTYIYSYIYTHIHIYMYTHIYTWVKPGACNHRVWNLYRHSYYWKCKNLGNKILPKSQNTIHSNNSYQNAAFENMCFQFYKYIFIYSA